MPRGFLTLLALALCAAGVFAPAAQADFSDPSDPPALLSAAKLAQFCMSRYDTDYGFCAGYVTAVAEDMAEGARACHYGAARSQQFVDLFKAYAQANPDALNVPARQAVASALARAFSCAP